MSKLRDVIIKIVLFVLKKCKIKNYIVFESFPFYSDNTKFVFDELVKRNVDKKFKMIWIADRGTNSKVIDCENVKIIEGNNFLNSLKKQYAISAAKAVIVSNDLLKKINPRKQLFIDLAHGAALKNCSSHYNLPDCYDKAVCLSPYLAKYDAVNFNCDEEKMLPLGYPRNDLLFGNKIDLHKYFSDSEFDKAVYWMPTYRQHKNGKYNPSSIAFPIIYDEDIAKAISQKALDEKVLIIVKPHPAQDMSRIQKLNLSNLVFIDNHFLSKNNIENYELLRSVDALISDYSSVYYDYLLCDKPIGLCFDDFEEYNSNEGFTVDPNFILAGGEKIYNTQDLCDFIERIANGEDTLKDKRNEIKDLCHQYKDNQSTQRVADYILNKLAGEI